MLSIFHNFTPNKIILCDGRGHPWRNDEIKQMIKRKNWQFQSQRKSCKLDFTVLNLLLQDISHAITSSKLKWYEDLANKLNDPKTARKTYWKILKTFVNGTKIPLIPPLYDDRQQQCYPSKYKFCKQRKIAYFWNLSGWYCKDYKVIWS